MTRKIFCIICFLFFFSYAGKGQLLTEQILLPKQEKQNEEIVVGKIEISDSLNKSLNEYFQISDTIDTSDNETDLVEIEGFDFKFKLKIERDSFIYKSGNKQILHMESRIPPYQSWRYDITNLHDNSLNSVSQELREKPYDISVLRQAPQTCISYALEGIFRSYGINPEPFFFRRSVVASFEDVEVILKQLFIKNETLDNVKTRTLKKSENLCAEQVLILFRNCLGEPIHACFNLHGRTWTKNGGIMPYTSHSSPYSVIAIYNSQDWTNSSYSESTNEFLKLSSVNSIEIYRLNDAHYK